MFQVEISLSPFRRDEMTISNLCLGGGGWVFGVTDPPSQLQASLKVRHSTAKQGIFSKLTGQ